MVSDHYHERAVVVVIYVNECISQTVEAITRFEFAYRRAMPESPMLGPSGSSTLRPPIATNPRKRGVGWQEATAMDKPAT